MEIIKYNFINKKIKNNIQKQDYNNYNKNNNVLLNNLCHFKK